MPRLKNVIVRGFRSIKEMELELAPINVCIGANGAGKSNLIEFFKMINELMGGRLQITAIHCDHRPSDVQSAFWPQSDTPT